MNNIKLIIGFFIIVSFVRWVVLITGAIKLQREYNNRSSEIIREIDL